jgi:hypothetical protein
VDWYEAWADLGGEGTRVQVFAMRAMASGAASHRAYLHATQQAFLEAHEQAFDYFGGVFRLLHYDKPGQCRAQDPARPSLADAATREGRTHIGYLEATRRPAIWLVIVCRPAVGVQKWMVKPGGIEVVLAGLRDGNKRFPWPDASQPRPCSFFR